MVFIKKNKFILSMILGIIAVALIIPSISSTIDSIRTITKYEQGVPARFYFTLIEYICIFFSELIFIIIGVRRSLDRYLVASSAILYYASLSANTIYEIVVDSDYSSIFSLIIQLLCLIMTILAITKPQFLFGALVIIMVDAAFSLSRTFAGSTLSFSTLILAVLLIFALYFSCYNRNLNDVDYDQYS